jgi:hypothetical protein
MMSADFVIPQRYPRVVAVASSIRSEQRGDAASFEMKAATAVARGDIGECSE